MFNVYVNFQEQEVDWNFRDHLEVQCTDHDAGHLLRNPAYFGFWNMRFDNGGGTHEWLLFPFGFRLNPHTQGSNEKRWYKLYLHTSSPLRMSYCPKMMVGEVSEGLGRMFPV